MKLGGAGLLGLGVRKARDENAAGHLGVGGWRRGAVLRLDVAPGGRIERMGMPVARWAVEAEVAGVDLLGGGGQR